MKFKNTAAAAALALTTALTGSALAEETTLTGCSKDGKPVTINVDVTGSVVQGGDKLPDLVRKAFARTVARLTALDLVETAGNMVFKLNIKAALKDRTTSTGSTLSILGPPAVGKDACTQTKELFDTKPGEPLVYPLLSCTADGRIVNFNVIATGKPTNGKDMQTEFQKVWDKTVSGKATKDLTEPTLFAAFVSALSQAWEGMAVKDGEQEGDFDFTSSPLVLGGENSCIPVTPPAASP